MVQDVRIIIIPLSFLCIASVFLYFMKKHYIKKFKPILESLTGGVYEINNFFNPWDYRILSFDYKNRQFCLQFVSRNSSSVKFGVRLNPAFKNFLGKKIKDSTGHPKYIVYSLLKNSYLFTVEDNNSCDRNLKILLEDLIQKADEFDSQIH